MKRAWLAVALAGCDGVATARSAPIVAVSFNVQGSDAIGDPVTGQRIADELAALEPSFAMLQECVSCELLHDKLAPGYELVPAEDTEIGILYEAARWTLAGSGTIALGNHDGWGEREARWSLFLERGSGAPIYVYSTHWCVPIRAPDDPCDEDAQLAAARAIVDDIATRDAPVILGGDLNVFDGFEHGRVVAYLTAHGLVDTLRVVTPASVTTFAGNTWAPPGRIDYILVTGRVRVLDAAVAADSASDHRPVRATLQFH